jgi:tRNA (cytosine38-C5)-methyltransferase
MASSTKKKHRSSEIRYVELYAGIGGWRQALESMITAPTTTQLTFQCVAALDHSEVCRAVYQHNWPMSQTDFEIRRIEAVVTATKWEEWNADLVMLSPPCQPHTRQHDNQEADLQDPRSASFLHICRLLKEGRQLPTVLILENVVGFESSHSFQCWLEAIVPNYHVAVFHLDPTQVGVPNERPRFYSVAVRADCFLGATENGNWIAKYFLSKEKKFTSSDHLPLHICIPELGVVAVPIAEDSMPSVNDVVGLTRSRDDLQELTLSPQSLLKSASWCFDVVGVDSRRTSCFTSGYGKFCKGTGSVLAYQTTNGPAVRFTLAPPDERSFDSDWSKKLLDQGYAIRYFSGEELLRLFGFQSSFKFPLNITTKQKWKLVGNSLNVRVASKVVQLGLLAAGWLNE